MVRLPFCHYPKAQYKIVKGRCSLKWQRGANQKNIAAMDIPVNSEVQCADGRCGRSTYVFLNPTTEQMTHLVVKAAKPPHSEFLMPVSFVVEIVPDRIWLECSAPEQAGIEPFVQSEYIQAQLPEAAHPSPWYIQGQYLIGSCFVPRLELRAPVEHKHISPLERAVHRGPRVVATDSDVGQVDEFLVDPANLPTGKSENTCTHIERVGRGQDVQSQFA